ncbi:hypothetical protein HDU91_003040, partial [Kappamyces sp. JEL0680]
TGRVVSILAPYLIINKTGLDMFFSAKSLMTANRLTAGQGHNQNHSQENVEPIMFSYSTLDPLRSRAQMKIADSEWSKPVSFEAVGSEFFVNVPAMGGKDVLLGIDIQEGAGKYHMSKIVKVSPRFMLRNKLDRDLSFGQAGVLSPTSLRVDQVKPLMKLYTNPEHDDYHMCVRFADMLSAWSNPFSLTQIGSIFLKMGRIGSLTEDLIRVDITIEKATIFITFSKEEGRWPFRIENHTGVDVTYYQGGSSKQYQIVPGEEQFYAWDFPSFENKTFTLEVNGRLRQLEFTELGTLIPFKYPTTGGRGVMELELLAEGPTIVLKMSPYDPNKSVYQDTRKDENMEVLSKYKIRIEGIGISVISRDVKEIFYASVKSVMLAVTENVAETLTNLQIQWFQVDNQIGGSTTPIFIYPTMLQ